MNNDKNKKILIVKKKIVSFAIKIYLKWKVFLIKQLQIFLLKKLIIYKKKIVGVFPSKNVTRFINFHSMMIESKSNYPF